MPEPTHLVGQCIFQLETGSQEKAEAAFDLIAHLAEHKLPKLFDELFPSDNTAAGTLIIDRLEIDLGVLDPENLETDLLNQIRLKLQVAIPEISQDMPLENRSEQERRMNMIVFFIEHGFYPWWALKSERAIPTEHLLEELINNPDVAPANWLGSLLHKGGSFRRLNEYLQADSFTNLLKRLDSAGNSTWQQKINQLNPLLDQLPKPAQNQWTKWVQEATLRWWAERRELSAEPIHFAEFLTSTLIPLAADRLNISAPVVHTHLKALAEKVQQTTLLNQVLPDNEWSNSDGPDPLFHRAGLLERLSFFLKNGYLILQHAHDTFSALQTDFEAELRQASPGFRKNLWLLLKQDVHQKRFLEQFLPEIQTKTIALLALDRLNTLLAFSTAFTGHVPSKGIDGRPEPADPIWPVLLQFLLDAPLDTEQPALEQWFDRLMQYPEQFSRSKDMLQATLLLKHPTRHTYYFQFLNTLKTALSAAHPEHITAAEIDEFAVRYFINASTAFISLNDLSQTILDSISEKSGETVVLPDAIAHLMAESPERENEDFDIAAHPEKEESANLNNWKESLLFFLEHGRLPNHENISAEKLEQLLLQLIEQPGARQTLATLQRRVDIAGRLARQFSETTVTRLIETIQPELSAALGELEIAWQKTFGALFSKTEWFENALRILLDLALSSTEAMAQALKVAAEKANLPLQTFSDQLHWPENSAYKPGSRPTENPLLFFLEHGRLPNNETISAENLEHLLLQLIEQPGARQTLAALQRRVDIAGRLVGQFSESTVTSLIEIIHPELSAAFGELEVAWQKTFGALFSKTEWFETTLRILLDGTLSSTEAMAQALKVAAEKAGLPLQTFSNQLHWPENSAYKPGPRPTENPLLFFLEHGRLANNETISTENLEQLLLQLLEQPGARQTLATLQRRVDIAGRLARQFSETTLAKLIETIHPELSADLGELEIAWQKTFGALFSKTEWFENALRILLDLALSSTEAMAQALKVAAEKANLPLQTFSNQLHWPENSAYKPGPRPTENPLMFFLEHGRLANNETISAEKLEQLLLQLIEHPGARETLATLQRRVDIAGRLARQFSETTVTRLIETIQPELSAALGELEIAWQKPFGALFSKTEWFEITLRILLDGTLSTTEAMAQALKVAAEKAGLPLQSFSDQLHWPENSAYKPGSPPTENPLLFFLEHGRLANNETISPENLEQLLLQLLEQPGARQTLAALQQRVDIAGRLARQFSEAAVTRLIETIHPELSAALGELEIAWQKTFGALFSKTEWFETILRILLDGTISTTEAMAQALKVAAEKAGLPLQSFSDQLHWPENSAYKPGPRPTENPLLFFLEHGRLANNETISAENLEQLLLQLLEQPNARENLAALQRRVDIAERLARQFSETTLAKLIQTIHPELSAALGELEIAWQKPFGALFSKTEWLETILRILLDGTLSSTEAMAQALKVAAEKAGLPLQTFSDQLHWPENSAYKPGPRPTENPLLFFLEHGRLADNETISAENLEQLLLQLLEQPGAREILATLQLRVDIAGRLASQFSEVLMLRLISVFLKESSSRTEQLIVQFSDTVNATFPEVLITRSALLETLLRYVLQADFHTDLGAGVQRHLVSWGAGQTGEAIDLVEERLQTTPISAVGDAPSTIKAEAETVLFYFFEHGRLPRQSGFTHEQLDELLGTFLQKPPSEVRSKLMAVNRAVNLASRLASHFSAASIQKILQVMLADRWGDIAALVDDFTRAINRLYPGAQAPGNYWSTALSYFFERLPGIGDETGLIKKLLEQAEYLTHERVEQALAREWLLPEYHASSRLYLSFATTAPDTIDTTAVEALIDRWEKPVEVEKQAMAALDRMQYRMLHQTPAWWDDPATSSQDLIRLLMQRPFEEARAALQSLLQAGTNRAWLAAMPAGVIQEMVALFAGDYNLLLEFLERQIEQVSHTQEIRRDLGMYRGHLLTKLLALPTLDSELLVQITLESVVEASGRPFSTWVNWLNPLITLESDRGNLYAKRILTVVPALNPEPLPPQPVSPPPVPTHTSRLEQELEAFRQFLVFGTLPRAFQEVTDITGLEQLMFRMADRHPTTLRQLLLQAMAVDGAAERANQYFSERLRITLATLVLGETMERIVDHKNDLFFLLNTLDRAALQSHFIRFLMVHLAPMATNGYQPERYTKKLIEYVAQLEQLPEAQLWLFLEAQLKRPDVSAGSMGKILPALIAAQQEAEKPTQRAREPEPETPEALTLPPEEAILLQNAGLVVVAPFLPRLFSTLGLLENRQFLDDQSAEKAVHLLQYLATGLDETPEHELVLNKILCGIPLEKPIPLRVEFTDAEKAVCESMLAAVLQNWEKMQKSSITNLRGAFLLREGLLREHDSRWMLQVERKAYDIVLEFLPWTINMIKLPWMTKRLDTIWTKKT